MSSFWRLRECEPTRFPSVGGLSGAYVVRCIAASEARTKTNATRLDSPKYLDRPLCPVYHSHLLKSLTCQAIPSAAEGIIMAARLKAGWIDALPEPEEAAEATEETATE